MWDSEFLPCPKRVYTFPTGFIRFCDMAKRHVRCIYKPIGFYWFRFFVICVANREDSLGFIQQFIYISRMFQNAIDHMFWMILWARARRAWRCLSIPWGSLWFPCRVLCWVSIYTFPMELTMILVWIPYVSVCISYSFPWKSWWFHKTWACATSIYTITRFADNAGFACFLQVLKNVSWLFLIIPNYSWIGCIVTQKCWFP